MHRFLLNATLYALATVIVSCLLTTMVMFISTGSSGSDIHTLLATQTVATPLALTIVIVDLLLYARSCGVGHGLRMIWSGITAWLILALVVLNSLVIIGELSFLLLVHLTAQTTSWNDHVPLLCMLTCSLAFAALFVRSAQRSGDAPAAIGRWP